MAQPTIQTSFASGEWAPKLRSRVDVQKYKSGASLLRNFYVDWAGGGASTRMGTQFLGKVGANGARLIPFQPSIGVSYVLEFGQNYIRFFSQGAQILSGGLPYQIGSPYNLADLFPTATNQGLKYITLGPQIVITHPNYPAYILTIYAPTNWVLTQLTFGSSVATPTGVTASTTLVVAASNWNYAYTVTAVDANGQESAPATPVTLFGYKSLSDLSAPGTNQILWSATPGAVSYNVYKMTPTFNTTPAAGSPLGFIGNTTALNFLDPTPGIAPDFAQGVPVIENPFLGSGVNSYTVTVPGTYTVVPTVTDTGGGGSGATAQATLSITSSTLTNAGINYVAGNSYQLNDPVTGTFVATIRVNSTGGGGGISTYTITFAGAITSGAIPTNPLHVADPTGPGSGGQITANTWGVSAVNPIQFGAGYTSPPTVNFSPAGASATAVLGPASSGNPGICAFIQERLMLAAQPRNVQGFEMSQPGSFLNFNISFPVEDDDAISGSIIDGLLNDIRSLTPVPTGILAMTGKAGWLINGGGGISTQTPITPTNITAQPQSYNGANYLDPIKIVNNILYTTCEGNYVRELAYNIYMQIFTGTDITTLSTHLFFGYTLHDWTFAEEPFKTLWAVRNDGVLLSLAYVKDQELMGWAHHDTNGVFKSVCSVTEGNSGGSTNTSDAVYVIVERVINGVTTQFVERMADRFTYFGVVGAFCVDCGLQSPAQVTNAAPIITGDASAIGNTVTLTDTVNLPFTAAMATNHWQYFSNGGIFTIQTFTSSSVVTATVKKIPLIINAYNGYVGPSSGSIFQPISSATLAHLPNTAVVGLSDGVPFTATTDGAGNFSFPLGAFVTAGLAFTSQLTTLPLDLGEPTVQGKRKKITAVTMRVADTLGLSVQTSAPNAPSSAMKDFLVGNINSTTDQQVTDLFSGDGRVIVDPWWSEQAIFTVTQTLPFPATILGVMPEVVVGDSPEGGRGK